MARCSVSEQLRPENDAVEMLTLEAVVKSKARLEACARRCTETADLDREANLVAGVRYGIDPRHDVPVFPIKLVQRR